MITSVSSTTLQDKFNNVDRRAELPNASPTSYVSIYAWIVVNTATFLLYAVMFYIIFNICCRTKRIFAVWIKPAWQLIYFAKKICSQLVLRCAFPWKWHYLAPIIISVEIYIKYLKGWQKRGMNAIFHITLHILITVKC